MKIFLDFDDVLFNTREFRFSLERIFSEYGVDSDLYQKTRAQAYAETSFDFGTPYDLEQHILAMREFIPHLDVQTLISRIDIFLKHTEKYVFSDVLNFLQGYPKQSLFILTYGGEIFQRKKVIGSGVAQFVQDVLITQKNKAEELRLMTQEGDTIFLLDDRSGYMEDVKDVSLGIHTILVSRSEGRYSDVKTRWCDFQVQNLDEVKKIIEELEY